MEQSFHGVRKTTKEDRVNMIMRQLLVCPVLQFISLSTPLKDNFAQG